MLLFLAINGVELRYAQHELSDVFLKLAAGEVKYEDILEWVIEHEIYPCATINVTQPSRSIHCLPNQHHMLTVRDIDYRSPSRLCAAP